MGQITWWSSKIPQDGHPRKPHSGSRDWIKNPAETAAPRNARCGGLAENSPEGVEEEKEHDAVEHRSVLRGHALRAM